MSLIEGMRKEDIQCFGLDGHSMHFNFYFHNMHISMVFDLNLSFLKEHSIGGPLDPAPAATASITRNINPVCKIHHEGGVSGTVLRDVDLFPFSK